MKKLLLIFLIHTVPLISYAQKGAENDIAKIKNKLKSATDTNRLNLYQDIFWKYLSQHADTASLYADSAIVLAKKLNHTRGLGSAYRNKGRYYFMRWKFSEALTCYHNCIKQYKKAKYPDGLANIYHDIGMLYFDAQNFDKAIEYYKLSIKNRNQSSEELHKPTIF